MWKKAIKEKMQLKPQSTVIKMSYMDLVIKFYNSIKNDEKLPRCCRRVNRIFLFSS